MELNEYINLNLVHSIHTSGRRSFRGCRRRWNWIFHDGYYPLVTPRPLEFGVAYHKAMEVWYDPEMWGINRELAQTLAIETFRNTCNEQRQAYMDKHHITELDHEMAADYEDRILLGTKMLENYSKTSAQLDTNFKPIRVEIPFEVPITGPNGETLWCKCQRCWNKWVASEAGRKEIEESRTNMRAIFGGSVAWDPIDYSDNVWKGLPVTYGGRVDMLAEDLLGRYWIFDWKTATRLSTGEPNAPDDYLYLDDQITSYCWALQKVLQLPIAGFVYHEQKKAYPVEPEPFKNGMVRLGCMYSKNKQMDTDWQTYETTVKENDTYAYEQGYYDEFIEYLKEFGGVFHKRHQIERSSIELTNAGFDIFHEAADMVDPNLRIYPSPGRFTCNGCAFREPCLGMNRGDDYIYTLDTMFEKRPQHYYEVPSTDKPGRG